MFGLDTRVSLRLPFWLAVHHLLDGILALRVPSIRAVRFGIENPMSEAAM
jgi:hypothetical protein